MNEMLGGGFGILVSLFIFILAILWFLLPFAIFGTKDKLSELLNESQKTNEHLAALREEMAALTNQQNKID